MEDEQPEIQVPEITVQQLKEMMESTTPPVLVDVRESWEVARGMIPGALHIPMNSIPNQLDDLPRDKTIVAYCAVGARSYAVAEYLLANRFNDVKSLDGGIVAWAQLQYKHG